MTVLILNCDSDTDPGTNGGSILKNLVGRGAKVIDIHNQEQVSDDDLINVNKILISGSRRSIYENEPWIKSLLSTVRKIDQLRIPTLGICFGFQAVAHSLGGKVENSGRFEEGFNVVHITQEHWLFNGFSRAPLFYQSHGDVATSLPAGSNILALNNFSLQAFELRNFVCVQFHPEINTVVAERMASRDRKSTEQISRSAWPGYTNCELVVRNFITHN
jgi:GMP synthase-like glutamine amidotransferase